MRRIILLTALLFVAACVVYAQTPTPTTTSNLYGLGSSWNNGASPSVAGTGFYGHRVANATTASTVTGAGTVPGTSYPTFAVTFLDVLPIAIKPFTVSTNVSVGVAQQVLSYNGISFAVLAAAGGSFTGTNSGWDWTGGVNAIYRIKKAGVPTHFGVWGGTRWLKSSVSNGAGYQLIPGGGVTYHF